jgi:hypothetical protein
VTKLEPDVMLGPARWDVIDERTAVVHVDAQGRAASTER